ncbi:MAG: two-component regulator propeller domain-containing protein [Halieaceae bacterium]
MAEANSSAYDNTTITKSPVNSLLNHKTIAEVLVDDAGFLWIRSQHKVHRYDGHELLTLYSGLGAMGLGGIRKEYRLALDERGRLWFASLDKGLMFYDNSSREFVRFREVGTKPAESAAAISALHSDRRGTLWVGYANGLLKRIDVVKRVERKPIPTNLHIKNNQAITAIASDTKEVTWIVTEIGNLIRCTNYSVSCVNIDLADHIELAPTFSITSMLPLVDNRLLVGTESGLLIELVESDGVFAAHEIKLVKHQDALPSAITSLAVSGESDVWVGTERGLFLLNELYQVDQLDKINSVLGKGKILTLGRDEAGNLLIGTYRGLFISVESVFQKLDESHGLESNFVTTFSRVTGGNTLVGTLAGMSVLDHRQGRLENFSTYYTNASYHDERVTALKYKDGVLWIGFRSQGLQRINLPLGGSLHVVDPRSGIRSVTDIQLTQSGSVIVSTFGGGLHILDEQGKTLRTYRAADSEGETGLRSDKVLLTNPLRDGNLLIGTKKGLHIMSKAGEITRVNSVSSASEQANHLYILSILESRDGSVWVGTQNSGLYYWGPLNHANELKTLTPVDTSPGLPSNTIYAMEEDDRGMIWFSTDNGLVKLNPRTSKIEIFDRSDGLQDNEFNIAASHKDDMGNLYFGGNHGFNRFNPEQLTTRKQIPPLRLTEIVISGTPIASDPGYSLPPEILLTHKDHSIQFDFSTLDFVNPARSSYKYKLENHDREWVDIGSRNSVSFARLPSGEYTFKLIGANSDGIWNMDGITLPIRVLPPPWLQWWAFAAYGIFLLSSVLFIKKYYDTYRLKEFATQRAESLHETAERAQDELFDQLHVEQRLAANIKQHSINTIQLMSDLLMKQADEVDDPGAREALLENNKRLHCLKILEGNIYYRADSLEVDFHSSVNQIFREVLADTGTPEFQIVPLNESLEITIPEWLAIPAAVITNELVRNSVQHAFEGMTGVQTIKVYLRETEQPGAWLLEVADSGVGLPESIDPQRAFTAGMDVVKQCADRLNASISINRENGTSFRFEIPPQPIAQSRS